MNKLREVLRGKFSRTRALMLAPVLMAFGLLATADIAGATSLDPTTDVTTFATSSISQLYPIVLAVAGAIVALLVLQWGVRKVLGILRGRHTI